MKTKKTGILPPLWAIDPGKMSLTNNLGYPVVVPVVVLAELLLSFVFVAQKCSSTVSYSIPNLSPLTRLRVTAWYSFIHTSISWQFRLSRVDLGDGITQVRSGARIRMKWSLGSKRLLRQHLSNNSFTVIWGMTASTVFWLCGRNTRANFPLERFSQIPAEFGGIR